MRLCAVYSQTPRGLRAERFDLIVVSAFLSDQEKAEVLAIDDGKTPTIMLEGLTMASKLLTLVESRLAQSSIRENF
jgi:hypothetical protein